MIRIKGVSLEKSLELLRQNGIRLISVKRPTYTECVVVMRIRDFKRMRYILRRRRIYVKILKKGSWFLRFKALRRRKMLLVGTLLIGFLLVVSTMFIWDVTIEGDLALHGAVRTYLEEAGITAGMLKQDIDTKELTRSLLISHPEIAWAQARIEGMKLIVEVVKAAEPPQLLEVDPTDVVAAKDALVYSIYPLNGQAAVKEGQTVKKGDLLISGTMVHQDKKTRYVHAQGIVTGRVWYYASVVDSVYTEERVHTGRQSRQRWYCLLDWNIPIETGEVFVNYDEEWTITPLCDLLVPLKLVTRTIYEVSPTMADRDIEALKEELGQRALEKALSENEYRKILSTSVEFIELMGGLIKAEATIEALEDIGETVPLTIPETQEESIWSPTVVQK